ncbi:MAG: 2-hydroxyacyl-CoA dehydratase family protein [Deltaproteobacteria bacterium]|jgi:benzoyl-CoA reductase/2-hydroxyglutaryl-CoA dehydratase subunit BcrC/BadD/HgdB|nr:2-hydroxyacyl-CoA dehydratase family protein [Deltaproteobacteria bacterium]
MSGGAVAASAPAASGGRAERVIARAVDRRRAERKAELDRLTSREDYLPELEYFVSLYEEDPGLEAIGKRTGKRPCAILCLQAPIEIFWAQGFSPVKIYSGSFAQVNLTSPRLPALMCPLIKAVLGELETDPSLASAPWVVPLTCDWVVKFKEARGLFGELDGPVHMLEVPRVKEGPRARARWLSEIRELSGFLKATGGKALKRPELLAAVNRMEEARKAFAALNSLRRRGMFPAVWAAFIAGAFFLDAPERWTEGLAKAVEAFAACGSAGGRAPRREDSGGAGAVGGDTGGEAEGAAGGKAQDGNGSVGRGEARPDGVFLTGAPVFFPNYKVLHLMEEAGLRCLGDDMCSSERLFPRHVELSDTSVEGMLAALAEAYHRGCLCPVFAESERRAAIIREAADTGDVKGVVFHLLKGCHPYELDSFPLEEKLAGWGLKYLKIETDYSSEDSRNLLTRLEAFRPTLGV